MNRLIHLSLWTVFIGVATFNALAAERIPLFRQSPERPLTTTTVPASAGFTAVNPLVFDEAAKRLPSTFILPDVPLPGRGTVAIRCTTMQVLTADAVVAAGTRHGDEARTLDKHILVTGRIESDPGSFV
ncbi:MAG: hypothetical protein ACKOAX_03610, partial [Candidatus Kapaibacterium sp.]